MSMFQKAEKQQGKLRVAITGPSGSGKTFSALLIADGIAGAIAEAAKRAPKIAVLDTENSSASDYADRFAFDTVAVEPPYTADKYITAIAEAAQAGYDVLVLDSISHLWAGEGGLLQRKEALDSRGGNSYANWGVITKEHEAFRAALLNCKVNLIVTMRSKQEYVLQENEKGKAVPKKVGMAPIQRDGMEYEFQMVIDLGMDHQAMVSKDRTGIFDGKIFVPTRETGKALYAWRMSGVAEKPREVAAPAPAQPAPAPAQPAPAQPAANPPAANNGGKPKIVIKDPNAPATDNQRAALNKIVARKGLDAEKALTERGWTMEGLTKGQASELIDGWQALPDLH